MNNKLFVKKNTGRITYQLIIKSSSISSPCLDAALNNPALAPYSAINQTMKPKKATINTNIKLAINMFSPLVIFSCDLAPLTFAAKS